MAQDLNGLALFSQKDVCAIKPAFLFTQGQKLIFQVIFAKNKKRGDLRPQQSVKKPLGGSGAAAPGGFNRIWRHVRQIRKSLAQQGFLFMDPWPCRRHKGAM